MARGLSNYIDALAGNVMRDTLRSYMPIDVSFLSPYPDFFSFVIIILLAGAYCNDYYLFVRSCFTLGRAYQGGTLMLAKYDVCQGHAIRTIGSSDNNKQKRRRYISEIDSRFQFATHSDRRYCCAISTTGKNPWSNACIIIIIIIVVVVLFYNLTDFYISKQQTELIINFITRV